MNAERLKEMAGCQHKKKLIAWLEENQIPWTMNTKGQPVTTELALTRALERGAVNQEVEFE